jgi:diguanylate cyclase (GGDEF)-like protein
MMIRIFSQKKKDFNDRFKTIPPLLTSFISGVSALCFLLLALFCAYFIQQLEFAADQQAQHITAEKRVNGVAGLLSSSMNVRLNLTSSLSAFVTTRREFSAEEFGRFASILKNDLYGVSSLQLAPNGVVTYLTDLEKNKGAIGHDLLADPKRRVIAQRSIREHSYIIAGPIDLIQGGRAIIARRPIYLPALNSNSDVFWGFAIVLIDIDTLLDDAQFQTLRQDFDVAIRGKDGLGANGDVFAGEPSIFDSALALATITLPNASWQIAVAEKSNRQPQGFIYSAWYWVIVSFFAMTGSFVVYSIADRPRQLRCKINEATVTLRREINQRELAEKKIRYMALHDELTDLPNRRLFDELSTQALSLAKRESVSFAILFIDIDGFKAVNDSRGHTFGDLLLKMIAGRLLQQIREPDIVARFGGDEFVILLAENCDAQGAQKVASKIISAMSKPFDSDGAPVEVGASIGIAMYPDHGLTIEQLITKSDAAMYNAKDSGKNCFRVTLPEERTEQSEFLDGYDI